MPTNDEIIRSLKTCGGLTPMCDGCIFKHKKNRGRCFDTLKLIAARAFEASVLENECLREDKDAKP